MEWRLILSPGEWPERWRGFARSIMTPEVILRDDGVWLRYPPPWHPLIIAKAVIVGPIAIILAFYMRLESVSDIAVVGFLALFAFVPLLANLTITGIEAQITSEAVHATVLRRIPMGPTGWSEPLSAYTGLHACMVRWTDPPQTYDATRSGRPGYSGSSDGPVWLTDYSTARKRREGQLLLEHATDPSRTLLLARTDEKAIETAFAQDIATRTGLPLRCSN